ncbi:hypothetical protein DFH11DRAFT_1566743 [Phellopilus nigrolimitatus]|nr:hypothetical protein DFH11DRAFT_1566743 [Phellopilus nigrolimitatus]
MRKQGKATMTTPPNQLSILHMWQTNKGGSSFKDGSDLEDKGSISPPDQPAQVALERENVSTQVAALATHIGSKPRSSGGSCASSCSEERITSFEMPLESRPRKRKANSSVKGKGKEEGQVPSGSSSSSKLFPIFGKKTVQDINVVPPEATGHNAEPQKKSANKIALTSRSRKIKRTSSTRSDSYAKIVTDGADPSSQTLLPHKEPEKLTHVIEIPDDDGQTMLTMRKANGGSRDEPIVLDSSPIKPHTQHNPTSAGFFAPKKSRPSSSTQANVQKKLGEGDHADWPQIDTQHVRGTQQVFQSAPLSFVRAVSEPAINGLHLAPLLSSHPKHRVSFNRRISHHLVEPVGAQSDGHARRENILQTNATCPAISRFLSADYDISGSTWNERWRPRYAAEVLGNEVSAQYLRDWLLALEIKTSNHVAGTSAIVTNGPANDAQTLEKSLGKVPRGIKRTKYYSRRVDSDEESLDDWIADDDEEDGEEDGEDDVRPNTFVNEVEGDLSANESGSPWKPKLTRLTRKRPPDSSNSEIQSHPSLSPIPFHDFSDRLTNSILLAGPTGSGKTAAIYACAEELGWEVFEVYPGIGRRNGASLLSLVGDVSKNHIVGKASRLAPNRPEKDIFGRDTGQITSDDHECMEGMRKTKQQSFASFPTSAKEKNGRHDAPHKHGKIEESPIDLDERKAYRSMTPDIRSGFGFYASNDRAPTPVDNTEPYQAVTRQSIILLEEVDILFSEDTNFWPTVVTLIRESRRPVIMTCNDPTLVPCNELPLQTVLNFNACSSDVALAHMKVIYESQPLYDVADTFDDLTCCSAGRLPPAPDLRRAINSLQFLCQGDSGLKDVSAEDDEIISASDIVTLDELCDWTWSLPEVPTMPKEQTESAQEDCRDIDRLWRFSDALSMIDSDLSRSSWTLLEIYRAEGPSSDDELGYRRLVHESATTHLQGGIALYNYDNAIAEEVAHCARAAIGGEAPSSGLGNITFTRTEGGRMPSASELLRARTSYYTRVSGVLNRIVPVWTESVNALMLDYEPWVRVIDRVDALQETAALKETEARSAVRGGRMTRNSQRMYYQRYFDLDDEQRKVLRDNGLHGDRVDNTLSSAG